MVRSAAVAALVAAAFLGLAAPPCCATTIDPMTWEQLVLGADFVGVVQCTMAGGIVARYEVIESFKGPKAGAEISLRIAVNYWEPQFPIALAGERYFVTAYKSPPSAMTSTTSGAPVPLWWRQIPADYRLPLFQGMIPLSGRWDGDEATGPFAALAGSWQGGKCDFDGSECPTFEAFGQAVRKLVAADAEHQELALLRSLFIKALRGRHIPIKKDDVPDPALAKVRSATDVAQLVDTVAALARADQEKYGRLPLVLARYGRQQALKRIEAMPQELWPGGATAHAEAVKEMRAVIEPADRKEPEKPPAEESPAAAPAAERLATLRKVLAGGEQTEEFGEAFTILARHDPAPVAAWLAAWKNTKKEWSDAERGYWMGSLFAHLCEKDRLLHLRTLLKADDPWIRAAGAVYLCFDDDKEGMAELRKAAAIPGDSGAWAALAMARRGDASVMMRLLDVLATAGEGAMQGVAHRNLQKGLLVLLSNSAKVSGVEPPPSPDLGGIGYEDGKTKSYRDQCVEWWEKNKTRIKLTDPWAETLARQRVD